MPCRDSDAPDMGMNLPDMGSEPFESSPDAAQPGIDQAGSPQTDMEGPTAADIAMDAHAGTPDALTGRKASSSLAQEVCYDTKVCRKYGSHMRVHGTGC